MHDLRSAETLAQFGSVYVNITNDVEAIEDVKLS